MNRMTWMLAFAAIVSTSLWVPPADAAGRKWRNCGKGAAAGAAVGAIAGAVFGGGNGHRAQNALIGGAAGAAAGCLVARAVTKSDERHMDYAEQQAVASGEPQKVSWTAEDGSQKSYEVTTAPTKASTSGQECVTTDGHLVDSGSGQQGNSTQVYCKAADGSWVAQ